MYVTKSHRKWRSLKKREQSQRTVVAWRGAPRVFDSFLVILLLRETTSSSFHNVSKGFHTKFDLYRSISSTLVRICSCIVIKLVNAVSRNAVGSFSENIYCKTQPSLIAACRESIERLATRKAAAAPRQNASVWKLYASWPRGGVRGLTHI